MFGGTFNVFLLAFADLWYFIMCWKKRYAQRKSVERMLGVCKQILTNTFTKPSAHPKVVLGEVKQQPDFSVRVWEKDLSKVYHIGMLQFSEQLKIVQTKCFAGYTRKRSRISDVKDEIDGGCRPSNVFWKRVWTMSGATYSYFPAGRHRDSGSFDLFERVLFVVVSGFKKFSVSRTAGKSDFQRSRTSIRNLALCSSSDFEDTCNSYVRLHVVSPLVCVLSTPKLVRVNTVMSATMPTQKS